MLFEQISATFDQDWEVFETQQRSIDLAPDARRVNVRADAGQMQAIRLLRKKIEQEARAARA
jgi:vanillate O-demethylase oxygenase-like protein